jgi:cytochrome c oxidase subunit III
MSGAGTSDGHVLPAASGTHASGFYGVIVMLATEAALFAYLLFSYLYLASQSVNVWPPGGPPRLMLAGPNTIVLLLSSVAAWWGQRGIDRAKLGRLKIGLGIATLLGVAFLVVQCLEWRNKTFTPSSDAYGSAYFTVTGIHMVHVAVGIIILAVLWLWSYLGYMSRRSHLRVSIGVLYWHFVDAVWLAVFTTFYLSPYISR